MNRERIVDELFAQLVDLGQAEREAFLAQAAANDGAFASEGVIDEVNDLLRDYHSAEEEGFLQQPVAADQESHTLGDGQEFEGYRIVDLIAEGGMGEVYLAQDPELDRKVAIKLIKSHLQTKLLLRRFRNERQILANLQYSNIAKLFQAGASKDGAPFFVMEYVEGQPIDEYVEQKNLSVDDRLRLFRSVCSAVSYAHQNLVIHRDIKPSNILVTDSGEPKLLDFGIAKLLNPADTESDETATVGRVMTPQYASPEQVKGEPITTSTDVYSLGVLLYQILTGQRPYKLKHGTAEELAKAICEQEPTKPSQAFRVPTSVGSSGDGKGPTKVGTLNTRNLKSLRGDLDDIVLKALRKEPARRYTSVEQFSEDVRRYVEGLPVTAHKGTFSYRATKFAKRNKIGVAAAALILITLAGGIITTSWQARRARAESAKAQQRFNQVRKLAGSLMFDYHDEIAALPGATQARQRLVKDSLEYLDSLADDAENDVSLQREIGTAYQRIGDVQGGSITSTRGGSLTVSNLGDIEGAVASYGKASAVRERLAALQPANSDIQQEWGTSVTRLGEISLTLGKPTDAAVYFRKAIVIYDRLLAADPNNEVLRTKDGGLPYVMARALGMPTGANLGKRTEALVLIRRSLSNFEALAAEHPTQPKYRQIVGALGSEMANVLLNEGKPEEALENYQKGQALSEALVKENPTNAFYRRELAIEHGNLGRAFLALGKKSEALENGHQAVNALESLVATDPNDANARMDLANNYRNLANALSANHDLAGAQSNFARSVKMLAELYAKSPSNAAVKYNLALSYLKSSTFLCDTGDVSTAINNANEAGKIGDALLAIDANNAAARILLALAYAELGKCNALLATKAGTSSNDRTDDWREAREWYQKSLNLLLDMKSKSTLNGANANKPDELANEIAKCDTMLRR